MDDLLPEAFAVVREAARRALGMRHYDVQLMGGIVLHEGRIAEMRTGEGKTLVATLPVYLNALTGRGVHVVTVNDYLARRDAEWMGAIYRFLGLTVGRHRPRPGLRGAPPGLRLRHHLRHQQRVRLRLPAGQHGACTRSRWCSGSLHYAIVDEVDSILIDEARTPLIISGQAEKPTELYYTVRPAGAPGCKQDEDYTVDEKARTVAVTEEGVAKVEKMLGIDNLYDEQTSS